MAAAVVDWLEVVQIKKHAGQISTHAQGARHFNAQPAFDGPAVHAAGQMVLLGQGTDAHDQPARRQPRHGNIH